MFLASEETPCSTTEATRRVEPKEVREARPWSAEGTTFLQVFTEGERVGEEMVEQACFANLPGSPKKTAGIVQIFKILESFKKHEAIQVPEGHKHPLLSPDLGSGNIN